MIYQKHFIATFLFLNCVLVRVEAHADEETFLDPSVEIKTYELTVSPVGESSPALKYRLHSDITDTVPGNAATFYLRALIHMRSFERLSKEQMDRFYNWTNLTSDKLPLPEVKKWLETHRFVIEEIVSAARCESCDWGLRFQNLRGRDVIEIRMEEFQQMRQLARFLKLKAGVEIAERRFDDAVATLRTMHRLAKDVAQPPNAIVKLISTAITAITNELIVELIASEQAPNLYWALRLLPNPIPDQQDMARVELNVAIFMFPFLNDSDVALRSPEEWMRLLSNAIHEVRRISDNNPSGNETDALNQLSATMTIMRSYPIAKRELMAQGMNALRVEQMPVGQVVSIYTRNCYQHVAEEYLKWLALPFHEGQHRLDALVDEFRRDGYMRSSPTGLANRDPLQLNQVLLPAVVQINQAFIRQRRMSALLATVEAIRIHAAANQGKLPLQLSDIKLVPVPLDPASMRPFLYRVVDDRAELVANPTRPGDPYSGRRFRLKIR